MGIVEVVLSDVGQTDVIAGIKIEHIETNSAAELESTVKAVEIAVIKGAERRARAIILDLPIGAHCQITA